jgi:alpha-1,3-glucosyltransferase
LFIKIGATTATTFLLAFAPFLRPFPQTLLILLERIFPLQRGIFEDKVANFWCASNVVLKWKNWFAAGSMAKVCRFETTIFGSISFADFRFMTTLSLLRWLPWSESLLL